MTRPCSGKPGSAASGTMLAVALLLLAHSAGGAVHPKRQAFGAIAYEPSRRVVGYSYDFKSAREAKAEALRQCGDAACEVVVSMHNACGAVARGPGSPVALTGATRAEAEMKAMRRCGHKTCEIVAWACTK
jgi:hypothetical protein